ncbi:uncharacterized protein ACJ7VT_019072 [Polymixia lowei]
MAWVDNREREVKGELQRNDIFRVPWEELVISRAMPPTMPSTGEDKDLSSKDDVLNDTSDDQCGDNTCLSQDVKLLPPPAESGGESEAESEAESEGEYVELADLPELILSPQKGSLTQTINLHRALHTRNTIHTNPTRGVTRGQQEKEEQQQQEEQASVLQMEGLSEQPVESLPVGTSTTAPVEPVEPAASPQLDKSAAPRTTAQSSQSACSSGLHDMNTAVLRSGVLCLPVCTRNNEWLNPSWSSRDVIGVLLYFTSTLR